MVSQWARVRQTLCYFNVVGSLFLFYDAMLSNCFSIIYNVTAVVFVLGSSVYFSLTNGPGQCVGAKRYRTGRTLRVIILVSMNTNTLNPFRVQIKIKKTSYSRNDTLECLAAGFRSLN